MNFLRSSIILCTFLALHSCGNQDEDCGTFEEVGERFINDAVEAHGGDAYDDISFQFKFRDHIYTWEESQGNYKYSRLAIIDSTNTIDYLENGNFRRETNGIPTNLSNEMMNKYSSSINSVIYFVGLPFRLKDDAVQAEFVGETEDYNKVKVTFKVDGGGEDHEDEYCYWFNKETATMDYFAYNYEVNGGGARFRVALNPRVIEGIRFQDYKNYEAPYSVPLEDLLDLYKADSLKFLSEILTEDIIKL